MEFQHWILCWLLMGLFTLCIEIYQTGFDLTPIDLIAYIFLIIAWPWWYIIVITDYFKNRNKRSRGINIKSKRRK